MLIKSIGEMSMPENGPNLDRFAIRSVLTNRCFHGFEDRRCFATVHRDGLQFFFTIGGKFLAILHQMDDTGIGVVIGDDLDQFGKMISVPFTSEGEANAVSAHWSRSK